LEVISFCRKRVRRLWRSEFLRNVALLASGTAGAQVIMVAAMPILSRLYDPESFGALAFFTSVATFFTVLSTFRYELAIPLPREDDDAANVFALTCLIALTVSLVSIPAIVVAQSQFDLEVSGASEVLLIVGVPLAVLTTGCGRALGYWATRRKNFKWPSISSVVGSFSRAVVQILGGVAGLGADGLIVGRIVGRVLAITVMGYGVIRREVGSILGSVEAKKMKALAREHSAFPKYNLPRAIMNITSRNLTPLLLLYFFGPAVAGLYWFAFRLLQMPVMLIGNAIRRVYYQRAIEIHHAGGDLTGIFTKTTLMLAALAVGPAVVIVLFGPPLFGLVFGEAWVRAGEYSQWLVIGWLTTFVNVPSVMLIPVLKLQKLALGFDAVKVVLQSIAIPTAAYFGGDILAITAFSIVTFVANGCLIGYMFFYLRRHAKPSTS
jgi:O-antigen/teichoic acid export membrane protein